MNIDEYNYANNNDLHHQNNTPPEQGSSVKSKKRRNSTSSTPDSNTTSKDFNESLVIKSARVSSASKIITTPIVKKQRIVTPKVKVNPSKSVSDLLKKSNEIACKEISKKWKRSNSTHSSCIITINTITEIVINTLYLLKISLHSYKLPSVFMILYISFVREGHYLSPFSC